MFKAFLTTVTKDLNNVVKVTSKIEKGNWEESVSAFEFCNNFISENPTWTDGTWNKDPNSNHWRKQVNEAYVGSTVFRLFLEIEEEEEPTIQAVDSANNTGSSPTTKTVIDTEAIFSGVANTKAAKAAGNIFKKAKEGTSDVAANIKNNDNSKDIALRILAAIAVVVLGFFIFANLQRKEEIDKISEEVFEEIDEFYSFSSSNLLLSSIGIDYTAQGWTIPIWFYDQYYGTDIESEARRYFLNNPDKIQYYFDSENENHYIRKYGDNMGLTLRADSLYQSEYLQDFDFIRNIAHCTAKMDTSDLDNYTARLIEQYKELYRELLKCESYAPILLMVVGALLCLTIVICGQEYLVKIIKEEKGEEGVLVTTFICGIIVLLCEQSITFSTSSIIVPIIRGLFLLGSVATMLSCGAEINNKNMIIVESLGTFVLISSLAWGVTVIISLICGTLTSFTKAGWVLSGAMLYMKSIKVSLIIGGVIAIIYLVYSLLPKKEIETEG